MKNEIKKNVYGYIRVSTETQVQNGQGLEIQKQDIQKYCEKNNLNLVGFFSDEGISGADEKSKRTGLNELKTLCKNKNKELVKKRYTPEEREQIFNQPNDFIYGVVIQKMDRLARDAEIAMWFEKEFLVTDTQIFYVKEECLNGISTPMLKCMRHMMMAFAELEKDMIVERLASGRKIKAEQGYKPCGRLPFGYKYNEQKEAVIIPKEAKVINTIFELSAQDYSLQRIANTLNCQGITTKTNKQWTRQAIKRIIDNDFYISILTYKQKIKGNHPAIISDELWNKVHNKAA